MGLVYRAEDTHLHRDVALKFLPEDAGRDADSLERFLREARAASALNHPGICIIHDVGDHEGRPFLVLELLEGQPLSRRIAAGALPLGEILEIGVQLADALDVAHGNGIIHRDIKPANIFLTERGQAKILDFGLAKLSGKSRIGDISDSETAIAGADLTSPGLTVGTAAYMSPEQARGHEVDVRTDLFSLGVVLYEMAIGRQAFSGSSAAVSFEAVLNRTPAAPTRLDPDLPDELDRVIMKALEKDRDLRCQGAAELRADLKRLQRDQISGDSGLADVPGVSESTVPDAAAGREVDATTSPPSSVGALPPGSGEDSSDKAIAVGLVRRNPKAVIATLALAVVAVSVVAITLSGVLGPGGSSGTIDSIAVLPFENVGGDPDGEYLSDGITQTLINSLSKLDALRVVSWTSVARYKGQVADPQAANRELGVGAVLVGRVLQRGESVEISAELVNASDNTQLWGDRYSRPVADLLAIQENIAQEISSSLQLRLTGEEARELVERETENTAAYQLYLRGRHEWSKRTSLGMLASIDLFQQALELDPAYAQAYVGLADAYNLAAYYNVVRPSEAYDKGQMAILNALEIDDSLAEAHATLGWVRMAHAWDWSGAEQSFQRAIALNPEYSSAQQWYGVYLAYVAYRPAEGLERTLTAGQLDPVSPIIRSNSVQILGMLGRLDEAMVVVDELIAGHPDFYLAYERKGEIYIRMGRLDEAITAYERAAEISGGQVRQRASLAAVYATFGSADDARAILADLTSALEDQYVAPIWFATIHARLGETEQAITWLEQAVEERSFDFAILVGRPETVPLDSFATMRADPRVQAFVRTVGIPR
jgi:serine/threonine protein kinase/tetratricopeptide (TPR) repeat protein